MMMLTTVLIFVMCSMMYAPSSVRRTSRISHGLVPLDLCSSLAPISQGLAPWAIRCEPSRLELQAIRYWIGERISGFQVITCVSHFVRPSRGGLSCMPEATYFTRILSPCYVWAHLWVCTSSAGIGMTAPNACVRVYSYCLLHIPQLGGVNGGFSCSWCLSFVFFE